MSLLHGWTRGNCNELAAWVDMGNYSELAAWVGAHEVTIPSLLHLHALTWEGALGLLSPQMEASAG